MSIEEEARAAAYRQQERNRDQWERDNAIRMRGNDTAAQAIRDDWQPLVDARAERRVIEPLRKEEHDRGRWSPA